MRYKNAIMTLGILVALILSPFIGIARSWKEGIAILFGLLISVLTYLSTRVKNEIHTEETVVKIDSVEPVEVSDINQVNPQ